MATITMVDGRTQTVSQEQARAVWALKTGKAVPKTKKQLEYVKRVKEIDFDDDSTEPLELTEHRAAESWSHRRKIQDAEVRAILRNKKLDGPQKGRCIAERIKERQQMQLGVKA